jgi:hypothetical protein
VWSTRREYDGRAIAALIIGIVSLLLIYPFGILLGPFGLWLGVSAYRRINRSGGKLRGSGLAIAGVATSGIVCGFYTVALVFEGISLALSGSLIPAY